MKEAKESKERSKEEGEAEQLDTRKFDPKRNYYQVLGLDRSATAQEVRSAYKKYALLYHPDKHKGECQEQREAIAARFREVAEAFDVLTNEDMRAVYDKCRDYIEENPGKGLPTLTPEEGAQMSRGAGELSRMRRMGPKLRKHDALYKQVDVSLPKLNFGCTKAVSVDRRRVDYSGKEFVSTKTFHLVIRKGSREGDTIVFEDEGEESVDTHPGDLVFTLRSKPHAMFRRSGDKDLEVFASALPQDEIFSVIEIESLSGKKYSIVAHPMKDALQSGGTGGVWKHTLRGQGLYDALSPWENPAGDLHITTRYPPCFVAEKSVSSSIRQGSLLLVGSSEDSVPASMVGGYLAHTLRHSHESYAMINEYEMNKITRVVHLRISHQWAMREGENPAASNAIETVLTSMLGQHELIYNNIDLNTDCLLLDDMYCCIGKADVIIMDMYTLDANMSQAQRKTIYQSSRSWLESCGVLQLIWQQHMKGSDIIAIEGAISFLGRSVPATSVSILPWYSIRPGGGTIGWDDVCAAIDHENETCVGVLEGSVYTVDPATGEAEMLVAPYTDALIRKAQWAGPTDDAIDDAEEEYGFMIALQK